MQEIVLGSRNRGKLGEIQEILAPLAIRLRSLAEFHDVPDIEETGSTFRENAELKAVAVALHLNTWVLADDSGLEVDALDGAPGVYSARFAGTHGDNAANNRKLLSEMEGIDDSKRTARFRCVIALASPEQVLRVVDGAVEGIISREPRGDGGFGYDPLFLYPAEGKTFGELPASVKNLVSHRANALRKLVPALSELLQ